MPVQHGLVPVAFLLSTLESKRYATSLRLVAVPWTSLQESSA